MILPSSSRGIRHETDAPGSASITRRLGHVATAASYLTACDLCRHRKAMDSMVAWLGRTRSDLAAMQVAPPGLPPIDPQAHPADIDANVRFLDRVPPATDTSSRAEAVRNRAGIVAMSARFQRHLYSCSLHGATGRQRALHPARCGSPDDVAPIGRNATAARRRVFNPRCSGSILADAPRQKNGADEKWPGLMSVAQALRPGAVQAVANRIHRSRQMVRCIARGMRSRTTVRPAPQPSTGSRT